MKFSRGTVVRHKVMGKGMALNEVDEGGNKKIEVRMKNGQIENFYPEELETGEEYDARLSRLGRELNRASEDNMRKLDPYN